MRIHAAPKYADKELVLKAAEGLVEPVHVIEDNSGVTSGYINRVGEEAFEVFKEYLGKLRGHAHAITVTSTKEDDTYLKGLGEAKRAPDISLIDAGDVVDRVLLLEEPAGLIPGPMSYIMLARNENGNSYMLQRLEKGSVSDEHVHGALGFTKLTEYHIGLFGVSEEVNADGFVSIGVDTVSAKPPGMAHMIRNNSEVASRNLIVMTPASKGRDDKLKTNSLKWPA